MQRLRKYTIHESLEQSYKDVYLPNDPKLRALSRLGDFWEDRSVNAFLLLNSGLQPKYQLPPPSRKAECMS